MALKTLNNAISGGNEKYHLIDLLRGAASICILFVHYKHFFMGADPIGHISSIKEVQGFSLWEPIYNWGANAVQLFWLISGFVFLHVYAGKRDETWISYASNRFARLYPLHFLTLIIVLFAQMYSLYNFDDYNIYKYNDLYHFILNLFFASEWGMQEGRSFNGPIWSVSVEIFSYIMFFLALKYIRLSLFSTFIIFGLSLLAFAILKNLISLCLIYFWFGCFIYGVMRLGHSVSVKSTLIVSALTLLLSVMLAASVAAIPRTFVYLPIFASLVSSFATLEKILGERNLYTRYYQWIGDTSYGNYLWHSPLQMLFLISVSLGLVNGNVVYSGYFVLTYILLVIGVSALSFHFYEKPLQQLLRQRLKGARKPSPPTKTLKSEW